MLPHSCACRFDSCESGIWLLGTQRPPPEVQQVGNLKAVVGGASHDESLQAPVSAPVKGSAQGAHLSVPVQLEVSSVLLVETAGRQFERQRPCVVSVTPANGTQPGGLKFPPVRMIVS